MGEVEGYPINAARRKEGADECNLEFFYHDGYEKSH